ncbi:hypothetical protein ACFYY2_26195 [Streptomyces sp. NPDC001822]|uniref:hypothetical protein n=1 Tax=Streptomyces sp. NPDC001822 TaxID=3364614 RepID=UPI0036B9C8A3
MFRRRESVPFSFVAEADRFRSNVTPPPRLRASASQLASRSLVGLTLIAGFAGSLLFGLPALDTGSTSSHSQTSEASQHR